RLQTAETELLGLRRHGDVAGWEIPARYLQFLRDGEPARLLDIVRHNDEDVRSLARLIAHVEQGLGDAAVRRAAPSGDLAGLARAFAMERRFEEALDCLDAAVAGHQPGPGTAPSQSRPEPHLVREETDQWWAPRRRPDFGGRIGRPTVGSAWRHAEGDRLDGPWTPARLHADRARMLRRLGRHVEAEGAWLELADAGGTLGALAWIEIAKLREHRRRDFEAALAATLAALRLVERRRFVARAEIRLERDLAKRAARLRRRISRRVMPVAARPGPEPAGSIAVPSGRQAAVSAG
ncbi:MAG: ribonuclease H-like domain-containing protein, partial [Candidatus Limnocylindrales bacterium]